MLLIGRSGESLRFIREALIPLNTNVDFYSLSDVKKKLPGISPYQLILVEVSEQVIKEIAWIYNLHQKSQNLNIPILALMPQKEVRLRYRLIELGVDDYLLIPFDKLDIQTRVRNLLKISRRKENNRRNGIRPDNYIQNLQNVAGLLNQLGDPIFSFEFVDFVRNALRCLQNLLQSGKAFYFEVKEDSTITLHSSFPENNFTEPVKIEIGDFPWITKAVRLKKATILNQISSENPLYIYFKSHLNLTLKAFALVPVIYENQTRALLMAVHSDSRTFLDYQFDEIKLIRILLEIAFRIKDIKTQLKSDLDDQVWKFSYEYLESIFNHLNFGILVTDNSKKIRYLNGPAASLLRINKENSLFHSLEEVLGKENADTVFSFKETGEGAFERPEIELSGNEGEKILIGFNTSIVTERKSGETGLIITLKDITYSREMQEEMRRMDRLASLGVMASGIAHEIRNPLAGIKAIAQTFEEELSAEDPKSEYVKRIIRQVNRLDDMLRTLFSYAKPQKPNKRMHYIDEIIQEVMTLLKQKLQQHNIRLVQSSASQLPSLYIDSSQIQQVLFNLILNSIEAIEKNGEIKIDMDTAANHLKHFRRKPFFRAIKENRYVLVHISDNGCGISREDLQQIFNPFFSTKSFGTGLGLSIVYQIVKENDGIIYFESEPGKGTDCYLFLPAFEPEKRNQPELEL